MIIDKAIAYGKGRLHGSYQSHKVQSFCSRHPLTSMIYLYMQNAIGVLFKHTVAFRTYRWMITDLKDRGPVSIIILSCSICLCLISFDAFGANGLVLSTDREWSFAITKLASSGATFN